MKTHNLRPHLLAAQKENADKLAQNREVGKSLNIPTFSVRDDDHSIFRAMTTEKILQSVPSLAKRYEDPEFAALAQNDAENLGTIAKAQETPYDAMMREVRQTNEAKKQDSYSDEVISAFRKGWEKFKHNDKLQYAVRYEERLAELAMLPSEKMARRKQAYLEKYPFPEMAASVASEFDEKIARLKAREATPAFQAKWQKRQRKYIEQLNKEQYAAVEQFINYVKQNNVNTNTYETNQALKVWDEDVEGFWQGTAWVFSNPKAALTAAAESTGYGAVPLVGTAVATMATGGVGGAVTAAVTNANNEFDASREDYYLKALQKRGLELTPENLLSLIRDTQTRREIEKKAGIRAATIGVGSAISLGVASKITSPLLAAGRPVAAASSGMAVGAVEGGSSEALAQLLTEGKVDGKEVAMEALLEIPGSAVELTSLALRQSYTYTKGKLEKNVAQQQQVDTAVQQSELREKAPDLFHEIVEETVENSENEHIYIEGEALNQSGLAEQVISALPEYQAALSEAIATGGSVQISRTDYLTKISPDARLANELSSMMRFDEKGFSLNELAVQMEQETLDKARAEIEQAVTKQQESEQSSNAVRDLVLEQLATVNQFTPEVNQQMATLTASFYDAMASRLGTDAQSLYKRHKLTISDKSVADKKYHQLIGEQGSRALDATEEHTNRLNGLQAARSMETTGKDAKAIRLATNWERGADGKWRYEVGDANLTNIQRLEEVQKNSQVEFDTVDSVDYEINPDGTYKIRMRSKGATSTKDFIHYNRLQKNELTSFLGNRLANDILAGRGNKQDATIELDDGISYTLNREYEVQAENGIVLSEIIDAPELLSAYPELKNIPVVFADKRGAALIYQDDGSRVIRLDSQQQGMPLKSALNHEIQHVIQDIEGFASGGSAKQGIDHYNRLAGEVEARNVQSRLGMSEEERRNTLIRDTEDVAREDQIFLRDGGRADSFNQSATADTESQAEFDDTASRYGGEDAYNKAKADGKTKLNYRQWVQVRTPQFKKWFGDWELALKKQMLDGDAVAQSTTNDVPKTGIKDVTNWAAGIFEQQGNSAISPSVGKVILSKNSVRNSISHGKSAAKFAAFPAIKTVIEKGAVVAQTQADGKQHIYISAPVDIDGVNNMVTVLIHGDNNPQRMYLHSVSIKEKLLTTPHREAVSAKQEQQKKSSEDIHNILHNVLNFNENDVSKVTDPDTGEPLVVYHGSPAEFTVFDDKFMGANGTSQGQGFYFTPDRSKADGYGKDGYIMSLFLNIKKFTPQDELSITRAQIRDILLKTHNAQEQRDEYSGLLYNYDDVDYLGKAATLDVAVDMEYDGVESDLDIFGSLANSSGDRDIVANVFREVTGYDGVINDELQEIVALNPNQIKSATDNDGGFRTDSDNILHQSAQTPRGQYHPDSKTISLLENADLSTFQHELGHFFLESMVEFGTELRQQAQDGETLSTEQQQVINDLDIVMSWLGTDRDWWLTADLEQRREKHEQFAKGFEAYLMEGKSPSLELQPLFERMRNWFIAVYKQLKNLGVELNDDVRQVYGRLLASDEAITLAEQSRGLKALFETAEDAGMDSETFRQYQEHGRQASVDAMNYMHERVARDSTYFSNLKKHATNKLTQEARAARSLMKSEAEAAIMQRPVYRLWDIVSSKPQEGKLTAKLDKKSLLDLGFTAEQIKPLGRKVRASKGGVHPDVLADMLLDENGEKLYQSGAAMVDDLMSAKPPKVAIAELTDNLMLMRFGELYNEESIAKAADIAVHNDIRLRVLTRESNALAKATGGTQLLRSTARQVANETMGRKRVRDIRPGQFTRQEAAASKRADAAFKRGDTAIAAKEKRHQVLQSHLAKAAYEAQAEVLKHLRYFNRISKVNPQKINIEYRRQIESILERIDFRKRSLKSVDKSTNLRDWVEAQREQGLEPDIDERLLDESYRQSYHNMTLNELRGMVDSIKQIEHLGRLKNQLLTAKKQKDLEKAKLEIVANIEKNQYKTVNNRAAATAGEKVGDWLKSHAALHMKIPMIARIMDGNKDGGVMWEYIIRPANEKANYESTKRAEAAEKLTEILSPLFKAKDLNTRKIKSQIVDKNGQRFFTRQEVFAVALNMGNEGNLQRLLDGNGWTLAQVENLVSNLSTNELNAVQAAWDYMGSFRDEVAAKEIRVYGKEPDWVEAKPLKLLSADGDIVHLSGGYYPIKYDAGQNGRAAQYAEADEAKRLIQGAFTSATTRRSFTKNRSEKVIDRPLLLSLAGVYDGVNEVIHDLAWHEWLIDTNKLMRSSRVDAAIRTHHGKETNEAIKVWIEDIAAGDHRSRGSAYKFAAALRRNVSISALGLNFMSALKQPLGLTQTAVRVGYAEMIGSLFNYMANPSRMTKEAKAASEMMRNRSRTRFRDINEVRNTLNSPTWKQKTHQKVVANAYVPMMFVQQIVDVITWHAEYGKHIGKGDEARAVALADQAVIDSQGGGEIKDLSGIERHEVYHFFTPFYSFMNTAYNMVVATGRSPAAAGKKVADLFMLISAPALLDVLLSDLLKPGEDDELWWEKLLKGQISYIMGLTIFTKELSPAVNGLLGLDNFGWQGLPGTRAFKDASDFAKQAGQLEFDDAFLRTGINLLGITLGIPAVQINKTIKGAEALSDGDTDNPAALLMGYQK